MGTQLGFRNLHHPLAAPIAAALATAALALTLAAAALALAAAAEPLATTTLALAATGLLRRLGLLRQPSWRDRRRR